MKLYNLLQIISIREEYFESYNRRLIIIIR